MKRTVLVRILMNKGCKLVRHGKKHDIFLNPKTNRKAPVPRHTEIADSLCRIIMKQIGIIE
jgi:mRNA interferase HicA